MLNSVFSSALAVSAATHRVASRVRVQLALATSRTRRSAATWTSAPVRVRRARFTATGVTSPCPYTPQVIHTRDEHHAAHNGTRIHASAPLILGLINHGLLTAGWLYRNHDSYWRMLLQYTTFNKNKRQKEHNTLHNDIKITGSPSFARCLQSHSWACWQKLPKQSARGAVSVPVQKQV